MRVLRFFLAFFLLGALSLGGEQKKILLMTVPKSGTHLLFRAVTLITGEAVTWQGLQPSRFSPEKDLRAPHRITAAHLFPIFEVLRKEYLDRYIPVVLIRDPRDVVLSFASHLRRGLPWGCCPNFDDTAFFSLSKEEQLKEAILFPKEYLSPTLSFQYATLWVQEPSVFVCRFEDLVGPTGGGSEERQLAVLSGLASHLGFPKNLEEIRAIADELSGGTSWTFDQGRIGRWKEEYTNENLALFSELYGSYVLDWGYSENEM